jgi:hypothetical protein
MKSALLMVSTFLGCGSEQQVTRQTAKDTYEQAPTDQVDILWVVDDSVSMADEQAGVAAAFDAFVDQMTTTELDFRLGVVTTDMESSTRRGRMIGDPPYLTAEDKNFVEDFQARVQVGTEGSDREAGIDAAYQALSEPLLSSVNGSFLRTGAVLSVIYLSDENDCTDRGALDGFDTPAACYDAADLLIPVRELAAEYETLKTHDERILVSAIVGPPIKANCDGAVPGVRYQAMAAAFGGLDESICQKDFGDIMAELGVQASGILSTFRLSNAAVEESIEVWVDDVAVPQGEIDGWTYEPTTWIVELHDDAIPPRGSSIVINYEIANGSELPDTGI